MNIDTETMTMSVSSSNLEKRMAEVFTSGIIIPFLYYIASDIHVFISKRSSYNQTVRSTTYAFGQSDSCKLIPAELPGRNLI